MGATKGLQRCSAINQGVGFGPAFDDLKPTSFDSLKRFFDILGALTLLALLLPLLIATAMLLKITSRGPALYKQRRLTWGGRTFTMYKFRTMAHDAELKSGPVWTKNRDPRITPVGRLLRSTRFDELPQLINVLIGDMSLIGPRPERPELASELERQLPHFHRRHEVKGGITGLAQVSSGYADSIESYRKKLACDLLYVRRRSLWLDLKIAFRTVLVVLARGGR